jgi:hypothetical protein
VIKRKKLVVVDREAIKTEIQAMEDAFAESYITRTPIA